MTRIVVTGYMIRHPVAGNMLAFFQYLAGLQRLGHQVSYLEESGWDNACYNPQTQCYGDDPSFGIAALEKLMSAFGVKLPVMYVNRSNGNIVGGSRQQLEKMLSDAELLLNIGGVCALPEFELAHRRALIDMDPLFTQLGKFAGEDVATYDSHFSYGTNIGRPDCSIPVGEINWQPVVPPVIPDFWNQRRNEDSARLSCTAYTTICNWNAYGSVDHDGEHYGQKDEEFLRLIELPEHVPVRLELALAGAGKEIAAQFMNAGWHVRDAAGVSNELEPYRNYIQDSRAEFSAAKHAYVETRSGWFSDRSVCYLASGRPIVVQDTGIGHWLETGEGVLTFSDTMQAAECIKRVEADYSMHALRATEIAHEVFGYKTVLPSLLERVL